MDGPPPPRPASPPSPPSPPSPLADPPAAESSQSRARRVLEGIRSVMLSLRPTDSDDEVAFSLPELGLYSPLRYPRAKSQDFREIAVERAEPREEDCPICLVPMTEQCVVTPCAHHFHHACLEQYFMAAREPGRRTRCPLCRGSLHAPLPVEASSSSGRFIEVVSLPAQGERCHVDRAYAFHSLGGFASRPRTLYVLTSNDDRKTPASQVMWSLQCAQPVLVHLNFRSQTHAQAALWLRPHGWRLNPEIQSTVSSGVPNGPYSGPVFTRAFDAGLVNLYGANTWEGTYFVFVELLPNEPSPGPAAAGNSENPPVALASGSQ